MFVNHLHDPNDLRYAFNVVWFDELASLNREYCLLYFTKDQTIEMIDKRTKRQFLKRASYPDVKLKNLFLDATIVIFSRQLRIVSYADQETKEAIENALEQGFILIRPEAVDRAGEIIAKLEQESLTISHIKSLALDKESAEVLFSSEKSQSSYQEQCQSVASQMTIAVGYNGRGAISTVNNLFPNFRSRFGISEGKPGMFIAPDRQYAQNCIRMIFEQRWISTAMLTNCTCGVILPHAVSEGLIGKILKHTQENSFMVSAIEMFQLNKADATEFYEVYNTVVPECAKMVEELCNGPLVAFEVAGTSDDIVMAFREFTGPSDPEVAKTLRPQSLRALFGHDNIKNSVHCTDLPEDGALESEYFFSILQQ
ncbi:putative Nucleoside diphosphate kinase 7 [Blattamonas nauphoetae]|uniref:Nucleoside diphosphate kinase 7 n=1 Tax=Blattamonas nauphoetae TaxID=2049346 RepID=A0ABQ9Y526_9EUKA|nr:putative Nucleoside diphosphate kinase 7 [Blattamonas nauphoetae]